MTIMDKHGYPVTKIKGKPIVNFFRMLIIGNISQTIRAWRNRKVVAVYPPLNTWGYMDDEVIFYDDKEN